MKIRLNYVSNSSSSSYVCEVCGEAAVGYDQGPADFGMCECRAGHIFCEGHKLDFGKLLVSDLGNLSAFWADNQMERCFPGEIDFYRRLKLATPNTPVDEVWGYNDTPGADDLIDEIMEHQVPERACPICMFDALSDMEGFQFLMKLHKIDRPMLLQMIRNRFNNHSEFVRYLRDRSTAAQF